MARTTDNLDDVAARVLAALKSFGAIGRERAKPQSQIAAAARLSTRQLRLATLGLNLAGVPVATTCTQPMGMFIAQTVEELQAYAEQLRSRLLGNGKRFAAINRIIRAEIAKAAVEPGGQRRLCFT